MTDGMNECDVTSSSTMDTNETTIVEILRNEHVVEYIFYDHDVRKCTAVIHGRAISLSTSRALQAAGYEIHSTLADEDESKWRLVIRRLPNPHIKDIKQVVNYADVLEFKNHIGVQLAHNVDLTANIIGKLYEKGLIIVGASRHCSGDIRLAIVPKSQLQSFVTAKYEEYHNTRLGGTPIE